MIPWIVLLLVPLTSKCLSHTFFTFGKRDNHKKYSAAFLFSFFALFLFRAMRADTVGGDLTTYKELFYYVGAQSWQDALSYFGYEKGFLAYLKILYQIKPDFNLVLIVTALLYTYGLLKFIYDNSPDPGMSLFLYITLYFYGSSFNNERQAISIALLFLSYSFVKTREFIKFLFLVLLAAMFHTTSLVFIIVYFLYAMKPNAVFWMMILFSGAVMFVGTPFILDYIINHFYRKYIGVDLMGGGGYAYFILLALILIAGWIFLPKKDFLEDNNINTWGQMVAVGAVLQICSFTMGYFYRLVILFSVGMIIFLPVVLEKMNENARKIAQPVIIMALLGYYILELSHDSIGVIPYVWR